jgi:murein DD-endopeptidase MepM/ murein hydrolase activator NlpD
LKGGHVKGGHRTRSIRHDQRGARRARPRASVLGSALVLLVAASGPLGVLGVPEGASAQSTPTTSTTAAPPVTSPPPAVDPEHQSVPVSPIGDQDSAGEPVPTEPVVIPPPPPGAPPVAPPPDVQRRAQADLAKRQEAFDRMFSFRSVAARRFETLLSETSALEARFTIVEAEHRRQQARLADAKERLKKLAVARYVGTPVAGLNHVLDAPDIVDLSRRVALLGALTEADHGRLEDYDLAAQSVTGEFDRVNAHLTRSRADLAAARGALEQTDATLVASKAQLVASQTGGIIVAGGLSFPVAGPHTFTDSFGAPRMFGTSFAHLHEGTDVFAAAGTPLVAIERGVLIRVGSDTLGGTKLWLVGATGTRYYYAHLSAFAPEVTEGKVVQAGEVIGFVGSTGNAQGTSAHLHFEAHPNGGAAINPYPLLRIIDEAERAVPAPPKQ